MPSFNSLIESCQIDWNNFIQHDFVQQLGKGILSKSCFQHYLKQDYLFLIHFSRAWGLAVYKSRNLIEIREALTSLKTIVEVELDLHIRYCQQWNITEKELNTLSEAKANIAYTRYVLDIGQQGELLDLHIALAPCLIGYSMIVDWIKQQVWYKSFKNPYQSWLEMYASEKFIITVQKEIDWINQHLVDIGQQRFEQLATVFRNATQLEIGFWQMGLDISN